MANEDVDVHSLAVDCHMILDNLASQKLNDDEADPKRLADTLGDRLNAWGNYLGVFAVGSASLDRRLQNSPKVKESITQSLLQLHRTLQILIEKAPGTTGSQLLPEQGHLQSENNGDRRLLYEAADRTVDRLERFGRIIQRSSISEIQNRMELYAKDHGDTLIEDPSTIAVKSKRRVHPASVQAEKPSPIGDLVSVQRRKTPTAGSHSKSQREQWDGPYFHEQYGLWFRQRPDVNEPGGIKYEWLGPEPSGQGQSDPQIPRSQVADLSDDLGNLKIGDNAAEYSGSYGDSYLPQEPLSDYSYKGKVVEKTTYPSASYDSSHDVSKDLSQNAYRESEQTAERFQRSGPSKSATISAAPVHQVPLLGADALEPPQTIEETVRQDEGYRVEHSSKWKKGEVIKCLTAELRGAQNNRDGSLTDYRPHNSLKNFYVGPRRFIIVKTSHGRSTCVPILTYGQQGYNRPDLLPGTHSIVHSSTSEPLLLPDEPEPGYPAIAVDMTGDEELAMESRVNYSNLKTFEHNIPVIFIGTVKKQAQATVNQAVDECWANDQWPKSKLKSKRR